MIRRCWNGRAPEYPAVNCVSLSSQSISVPLSEIYCTYHVTDSTCTAARLCHYWSVRLEQSSGPCPQSELHRNCFQGPDKEIVGTVLAHSAHQRDGCLSMRHINWHTDIDTDWRFWQSRCVEDRQTYVMRSALSWQLALNAAMLSANALNATFSALSRAPITRDESVARSKRRKCSATSVMRTCTSVTGTSALKSEYSCCGRYVASPPGGAARPPLTSRAVSESAIVTDGELDVKTRLSLCNVNASLSAHMMCHI